MIRFIVESSLQLRFLVITIAVAIIFFGMAQLGDAPVAILPEFSPPFVEIQTEALGLSAAEVEAMITVPLEADLLNGVAWLDEIHSESVNGLSSIILMFEPGTDVIRARQMVQERLTQAHALPNVSKPPVMLQPLSSSSRVMMVELSSDVVTPIEMSVLARWNIKPRLMGVPGVANVAIWGQRKRQLQVQVDPKRLQAAGVTLDQIIKTTGEALWVSPLSFLEASTPGTGGWIDTPNQRLGVRHLLPITTPEDLAQVTVADSEAGLQLGDVAEVVEDHQPLIGDAILNEGTGLLLVIEKFPGENALGVTRGVEEALEALKPGLSGIEVDTTAFRPATFIETAIDNLSLALLIGAVLVIVALFAFLYHWRVALISLVTIPLSLLVAGLVLYFQGVTINMVVLAGLLIALGAIIDNAIVDAEHIMQRLRQERQVGRPIGVSILRASLEVRSPMGYATLIIILAVVPFFFLDGIAGAFSQELVLSYALALLASMLVALTVTPALSIMLLSNASLERQSPLIPLLQGLYDRLLSSTVRTAVPASAIAVVLTLVGFALLPFLGQELLPTFKDTNLLVKWTGTPGTSRQGMNRMATQASNELRSIAGVRNVSAHVGRAVTGDEVVAINSGELWISLDAAADYDTTVAAIQETIDGYLGLNPQLLTYQQDSMADSLTTTSADNAIIVRLYGHETDVLRQKAEEVRQVLSGVEGIADAQVEFQADEPHLEIEVDLAKAEIYGLKPGDVRRTAATLLGGIEVGSLFEEQKVFDVVVWSTPEIRHSLSSVGELLIDTPDGGHVQLAEVADVRIVSSPNTIKREAVSRHLDVTVSVSGGSLASVASEIESRLQGVEFPFEYHAELVGGFPERQASQQQLLGVVVAAAIAIFLLLQASYNSWSLATVSFLTLPMALTGGVLATLIGGGNLSLGSLAGFITVLGITIRNGMMLITHYRHLEQHEGEPFGPELVQRGTRERLVPILMTAITMGVAVLPLVIFGNIAGHEIARPMAIVILGGLLTSTLLNLVVIPALYLRFGASPSPEADMSSMQFSGQMA